MNRAQRRRARRAGVDQQAIRYAETYSCPDCAAETDLDVVDGVAVLTIAHDQTCPAHRGTTPLDPTRGTT